MKYEPEVLTAVILAGGTGTRLHPYTMAIPKPLLPLADTPILEVVIRQLVDAGIGRVILTLGHMAPFFTAYFGAGERLGVQIEYCFEDEPLGTAAPLLRITDLPSHFLVMNGDVLTTLNYRELMESHRRCGAGGTISVKRREVHVDFGVVEVDAHSGLSEYREKPTIAFDVSMGINVLSREALHLIPENARYDMPDLMLALRDAGRIVHCYRTDCYWQDIGRFDDYQRASADFAADPSQFLPTGSGASCIQS